MERLEITEVNLSKIYEVETNRLDSEYFLKKYLRIIEKIEEKKEYFGFFRNFNIKVDASAFYPSLEPYYNAGDFPFLRVADVDTQINYANCVKIPKSIVNDISFNTLRVVAKGDIVITKGGSVGRIGLIEKETAVTRDLIFINSSILNEIDYKFLYLYLLSNMSFDLLIRSSSMTAQPHLTIKLVRDLPVFNPSKEFKLKVVEGYNRYKELLDESKLLYLKAEEALLQEIGLFDFQDSKELVNIKKFKDSFVASGRLDAEYYQPKFDVLEDKFDNFKRIRIADLVSYPVSSGITPKAGGDDYSDFENGVAFVRAVDLKNGEVSISNFNFIKPEIHNGILKRTQLKRNDVLLSIAGTVGRSAIFLHDFKANINQAVAILRFDEVEVFRLYLVLFFNSFVGKEYVSKYARQGVQTNLSLAEIGNLSIPIIDYNIQKRIVSLIEKSSLLKQQSEQLLEITKRSIEIAIEENEVKALKYIEQNMI